MSLVRKVYQNISLEEDLKNMLSSIKIEANKLEGLANRNGSRKELNKIVHKLNEIRTLAENCQDKSKKYHLEEIEKQARKIIKKIRNIENNLFRSVKNGNYYEFN